MRHTHDKVKISIAEASLFIAIAFAVVATAVFSDELKRLIIPASPSSTEDTLDTKGGLEEVDKVADNRDFGHPEVAIEDGQLVFLSGGTEPAVESGDSDRIQIQIQEEFVSYTNDWQLDTYTLAANKKMAIYGTFHGEAKLYRVYRYDASEDVSAVLQEFDITDSPIFDIHHTHPPFTIIDLAPDDEHVYVLSRRFDHKNYIGLEPHSFVLPVEGGKIIPLVLPETVYQTYWFTNYEIAFSGATFGGALYTSPYVEIYNINTHEISSTKIPVRGAFTGLEPKINPDASAYAYYDIAADHGYACGGNISNLVIRSYPEDDILFRLNNLHKVTYRWLNNTELEITYTPTPLPLNEYPRRNQMGPEDTIQCLEEEVMIYQVLE